MCVGVDVGRGLSYKAALKTDATPPTSSATGGGLSRSHSSPNIAKMIHDEDTSPTASQLPRQPPPDRSTKPQMMYVPLAVSLCSRLFIMIDVHIWHETHDVWNKMIVTP